MDKFKGSSFVKMIEFSTGDFLDYSEITAVCYRDDYEEVLEEMASSEDFIMDTSRAVTFTSLPTVSGETTIPATITQNTVFPHAADIRFTEEITSRLLPGNYKMEISRKEGSGSMRTLKNKINLFHLDSSVIQ